MTTVIWIVFTVVLGLAWWFFEIRPARGEEREPDLGRVQVVLRVKYPDDPKGERSKQFTVQRAFTKGTEEYADVEASFALADLSEHIRRQWDD